MSKITDTIKTLEALEEKLKENTKLFDDAQAARRAANETLARAESKFTEAHRAQTTADQDLISARTEAEALKQDMTQREKTLIGHQGNLARKTALQTKHEKNMKKELEAKNADLTRRESVLKADTAALDDKKRKYDTVAKVIANL